MSVVDAGEKTDTAQTQAEGPRARERQGVSGAGDSREHRRRPARRIAMAVLGAGALAAATIAAWQLRGAHGDAPCTGDDDKWTGVWDDSVRAAVARAFAASNAPVADTATTSVTALLDRFRLNWIAMRADACRAFDRGDEPQSALDLHIACLDRRLVEARALTSALAASPNPIAVEHAVDATSALMSPMRCADVKGLRSDVLSLSPAQRTRRAELEARIIHLAALRRLGHIDDALGPARAIVAEARAAGDVRVLAEALGLVGALETTAGDVKAQATLQEALQRAHEAGDPDLFAGATVELAESLTDGDATLSREGLGVARVSHALVDGTGDPTLAVRLLLVEGHLQRAVSHRELALTLLQRAAEKSRDLVPENEMLRLDVDRELAWVLVTNMFHAEARAKYDAVIATATRLLGSLHPITVASKLDRCHAGAGISEREREAAPACFEPAIVEGDRVLGPSSRGMLVARSYYGATLVHIRRLDRAREIYAEALAHVPQDVWAEHLVVATDLASGLGNVELVKRNYKGALDHCSLARDNTEKSLRGFPNDTCVAAALLGLGRAPAALTILEPMAARTDGKTKEELGPFYFAYARAVWAVRHDAKAARTLAQHAKHELSDDTDVDAWLAALPR